MNEILKENIVYYKHEITRLKREKKNGHKSIVLWFTGLSGSGKSSISNYVETMLFEKRISTYILDGDNIRSGLCFDLSFTTIHREENIRRIGEVAKLMLDAGILTLVSVISPYKYQREIAFNILGKKNVLEIFVDTPISICKLRDPKKLYKKACIGKVSNFTGIQSIYEAPEKPDIYLNGTDSLKNNSKIIIKILYERNIINF